jgi:hemerythrin-like domain-containing protein
MKTIQILVDEHKNIKRMLKVLRQISLNIYKKEEIPFQELRDIIDFIRNYADRHHHNKEEEIYFEVMKQELGEPLASGPIFAMFSEHDLGRLFIKQLEEALNDVRTGQRDRIIDVIANAIAYTDLLDRHIDKEDNTIYVFGENQLSEESLKYVEKEMLKVEAAAKEDKLQEKYINLLNQLEEKYIK